MQQNLLQMERIPAVVIGGGVVGLACARKLSLMGVSVLVIERNRSIGLETSSRNSGVIHAGIYYKPNSLKAKLCIRGKRILQRYIEDHSIPINRCGKLIVSTSSVQDEELDKLRNIGLLNGVTNLNIIDKSTTLALEPNVVCSKALWSPETAVFDTSIYMQHLHRDVEDSGSNVVYNCEVQSIRCASNKEFIVETSQGIISCGKLINCAGLDSIGVIRSFVDFPPSLIPRQFYAKGNYFKLLSSRPFSRLIYPIPERGGLGIHSTIDMSGCIRFGPDVQWMSRERNFDANLPRDYLLWGKCCENSDASYEFRGLSSDLNYGIDQSRSEKFYGSIRKYWPELPDSSLVPDFCGIRSKLTGPTSSSVNCSHSCTDFVIQGPQEHGIGGLVNLFGIESPGMTSSLAIGDYVYEKICN